MIELQGKYTSAKIFADTVEEGIYSQVYDIINSKAFEGLPVVCMPDVHVGASGPCGLVARVGEYVCPEHIGVDIGCSVSMIILDKPVPQEKYQEFEHKIKTRVPFGFELHSRTIIDEKDFRRFLSTGFSRYRQKWPEMLGDLPDTVTEDWISKVCKRVGIDEGKFYKSLGTVGGGNHFIEYDESQRTAGVTCHFGSRNFGLKVCQYWMKQAKTPFGKSELKEKVSEFKKSWNGPKTELKGAIDKFMEDLTKDHIQGYLKGPKLSGYLCDMCLAQLYAQYNHKTVHGIIKDILRGYGIKVTSEIMTTHNYIDLEDRTLRKSSVRAASGETFLVPFNMRDGIAICKGLGNPEWLESCSHGAGRKLSRSKAKDTLSLEEFKETMKDVYSTTVCRGTIDESPMAYKDTEEIKRLIQETCEITEFLVPKINIKASDGGD